jgi:hypothetical protein
LVLLNTSANLSSRFGQLEQRVLEISEGLAQQRSLYPENFTREPPSISQPQTRTPDVPAPRRHEIRAVDGPEYSSYTALSSNEHVNWDSGDESIWPRDEEASSLLALYDDELCSYFPFVHPPKPPISDFRQRQPYVFKAMIMAASYRKRSLQKRRGRSFIEELSRELLIQGKRSLDMLQALLIHIAWFVLPLSLVLPLVTN